MRTRRSAVWTLVVLSLLAAGALVARSSAPRRAALAPESVRAADRGADLSAAPDAARVAIATSGAQASSEVAPIRILTRSSEGSPVPRVEIHAGFGAAVTSLGSTDEQGVLVVPTWNAEWIDLYARRSGLATACKRLPVPPVAGSEVVAVLAPPSSLRGRVHWLDGSTAGPGITVVALPTTLARMEQRVSRATVIEHPGLARAVTRDDGTFEITDLSADGSWIPWAGGPGVVQPELHPVVESGASDVELTVGVVFGARVLLVDQDGRPVECDSRSVVSGRSLTIRSPGDGCKLLGTTGLTACLAGLDPDSVGLVPAERLILSCCPTRDLGSREVRYTGRIPGYANIDSAILLEPIGNEIPTRTCVVNRTASGFGDLEASLAPGDAARLRASRRLERTGVLRLVPADSTGPIEIDWRGEERIEARVPFGRYAVRFECTPELATVPPRDAPPLVVEIGADRASLVLPPLPDGSLVVDVGSHSGAPDWRELRMIVGRDGFDVDAAGEMRVRGSPVTLIGPPFVLPVVEDGRFTVLFLDGASEGDPISVDVSNGSVAHVRAPHSR